MRTDPSFRGTTRGGAVVRRHAAEGDAHPVRAVDGADGESEIGQLKPQQFDVVVTTNMFGDILSDLTAGIVGGLGLAPALQRGPRYAMAQASHGSAPDIAGQGIANPYAEIMSMQMLLEWLGTERKDKKVLRAAAAVERGVREVIAEAKTLTPDMGGTASTSEMGKAIAARVAKRARRQ